MDGQLIAVIALVVAAGLYLARRSWRTWSGKKSGCATGCSCSEKAEATTTKLIPSESLTLLKR